MSKKKLKKEKALKPSLQPVRWYEGVPYRGAYQWSRPKGRDMRFHDNRTGLMSQYRMDVSVEKDQLFYNLKAVNGSFLITFKKPKPIGSIIKYRNISIKITGTEIHNGKKYYTVHLKFHE